MLSALIFHKVLCFSMFTAKPDGLCHVYVCSSSVSIAKMFSKFKFEFKTDWMLFIFRFHVFKAERTDFRKVWCVLKFHCETQWMLSLIRLQLFRSQCWDLSKVQVWLYISMDFIYFKILSFQCRAHGMALYIAHSSTWFRPVAGPW